MATEALPYLAHGVRELRVMFLYHERDVPTLHILCCTAAPPKPCMNSRSSPRLMMACLRQSTRDVVAAGRASIKWCRKRPRSIRNREISPSGLCSCRDGVLTAEAEVQVDRLASPNARTVKVYSLKVAPVLRSTRGAMTAEAKHLMEDNERMRM